MAIPDYQSLMRPLLACGQDGQEKNINDCIAKLAKQFELTDEERERLLPSGKTDDLRKQSALGTDISR